jgi:hypothetical protein
VGSGCASGTHQEASQRSRAPLQDQQQAARHKEGNRASSANCQKNQPAGYAYGFQGCTGPLISSVKLVACWMQRHVKQVQSGLKHRGVHAQGPGSLL